MEIFNLQNYFLNPYAIPHLISGIIILWLGVYVLFKNFRAVLNVSFFFVCLSISLWLIGHAVAMSSQMAGIAYVWIFISYHGVVYITVGSYWFLSLLIKRFYKHRYVIIGLFIIMTFYAVLLHTPLGFYFLDKVVKHDWGFYAHLRLGLITYAYVIFWSIPAVIIFPQLFWIWRKEKLPL